MWHLLLIDVYTVLSLLVVRNIVKTHDKIINSHKNGQYA